MPIILVLFFIAHTIFGIEYRAYHTKKYDSRPTLTLKVNCNPLITSHQESTNPAINSSPNHPLLLVGKEMPLNSDNEPYKLVRTGKEIFVHSIHSKGKDSPSILVPLQDTVRIFDGSQVIPGMSQSILALPDNNYALLTKPPKIDSKLKGKKSSSYHPFIENYPPLIFIPFSITVNPMNQDPILDIIFYCPCNSHTMSYRCPSRKGDWKFNYIPFCSKCLGETVFFNDVEKLEETHF